MNKQPYLFITSKLSRGLVSLATSMQKQGIPVFVASPANASESIRLRIKHLRIRRLRIFGRTFLYSTDAFRAATRIPNVRIRVLDRAAFRLARARKLPIDGEIPEFGLDLSVFNPSSVAILRQSRFLSEFNIAPHQKLVTIISPPGLNLDALIRAMKFVDSKDLVVAIFGVNSKSMAARLTARIEKSGQHIVCTNPDSDAATALRSSYAILSLDGADQALMMAALAVGRPTIWSENEYGIVPNIKLKSASSAENISAALNKVLHLSPSERSKIENQNVTTAKKFDVEKAIKKLTASA
jgi:hypothetical protein